MKFLETLALFAATYVSAQVEKLTLIEDPGTAKANAGQVAGYSLNAEYWSDGTYMYFDTKLKMPYWSGTSQPLFTIWLQFLDETTSSSPAKNWDVSVCGLQYTSQATVNTMGPP